MKDQPELPVQKPILSYCNYTLFSCGRNMTAMSSANKVHAEAQAEDWGAPVAGVKSSSNKPAKASRDGKVMDVGTSVLRDHDKAHCRRRIIAVLSASVALNGFTSRNPISFDTL